MDLGDTVDPTAMFDEILNGKVDTAATMFNDIVKNVATAAAQTAIKISDERTDIATDSKHIGIQYERQVDEVFDTFPILDPDSDVFDKDFSAQVVAYQQSLVATGQASHVDSVRMAAEQMVAIKHPELIKTVDTPAEKASATESNEKIAQAKKAQAEKAKTKVEKLDKQSPATTSGSPDSGEPAIDIESLTEEEFDALPEAVIRKLREDVI